jgi:hypothetical protein
MHELRRELANQAKTDILRVYGKQLAKSPITITAADNTLTLTERSSTGRRFSVTVRNSRIAAQNLKPYAFVF